MQAKVIGVKRAELVALGEALKATPLYVRDPRALALDVIPLLSWAAKSANEPVKSMQFTSVFESIYQIALEKLASTEPFQKTRNSLADTVLADALSGRREPHREDITMAFKLITLGDRAARGEVLPFEGRLGNFIAKVTIIVPRILGPARSLRTRTESTRPNTKSAPAQPNPARERLKDFDTAQRELTVLALDRRSLTAGEPREEPASTERFLTKDAVASLRAPTKKILAELRFSLDHIDPVLAVKLIEQEMMYVSSEIAAAKKPATQLLLGGISVDAGKFKEPFGFGAGGFAVGISDLLIVQQKLKAYEVAEFAHVENVL